VHFFALWLLGLQGGSKFSCHAAGKKAKARLPVILMDLPHRYAQLFKFLISKLNVSLRGKETFQAIGILDIFGFENFEHNHFEQFSINYANEKLQQYVALLCLHIIR